MSSALATVTVSVAAIAAVALSASAAIAVSVAAIAAVAVSVAAVAFTVAAAVAGAALSSVAFSGIRFFASLGGLAALLARAFTFGALASIEAAHSIRPLSGCADELLRAQSRDLCDGGPFDGYRGL